MTAATKSAPQQTRAERIGEIRPVYMEALTLVERLHRRLLDVIKDEFDRRDRGDVNSVQALLLYNIGDKELTASELRTRGYCLGSNVSYNVKKLVEMGYLHHARSRIDRRSVRISLTPKGKEVHDIVSDLYEKHAARGRPSGLFLFSSCRRMGRLLRGGRATGVFLAAGPNRRSRDNSGRLPPAAREPNEKRKAPAGKRTKTNGKSHADRQLRQLHL